MTKILFYCLLLWLPVSAISQSVPVQDTNWQNQYRAFPTKINNLVHTKLEAKFDYTKSQLQGKVWLTLTPHFYPVDSVTIDAKGMDIIAVGLVKGNVTPPLKYTYDGKQIHIKLDKTYKRTEEYKIHISYIAKPDELPKGGSLAISDDKGLYFINPKGEDKSKPTQIWTQGETESTSVWCPTIDKPNQKSTQEFFLVVPQKNVSLSNGRLLQQQKNADGTRTDYWKMDEPHAPYLFFIGIGDYAVVKDGYKGKELTYYVEKEYAPVAKKIFGDTPDMMAFFEKITGVNYPWVNYAQMTARDYVSGAMENTTATLHQESAQQDSRQLLDGNEWEGTIAHELFHHWFGNYVTAKSWSNLSVNESFANFSQALWFEHKYGKDAGDAESYKDMQAYLNSPEDATKNLARYYYKDKEDMFDLVSYHKGGRILDMLRNYLGEEAFYKGLNVYLTHNKFGTGEPHQLRLAMEQVSGLDLNWFFNQWFFGSGHPKLIVHYSYNEIDKEVLVNVRQTQMGNPFALPAAIDIYNGTTKVRHQVWVTEKNQTFKFGSAKQPELVNFDGDKILLATKQETGKTIANYIHQYKHAGLYLDRLEAINNLADLQKNKDVVEFFKQALKDRFHGLKILALQKLDMTNNDVKSAVETAVFDLAKGDIKTTVRAEALPVLANYDKIIYRELIERSVNDSSYSVAGSALQALKELDKDKAYAKAKEISNTVTKDKLAVAVGTIFAENGNPEDADYVIGWYDELPFGQLKFDNTNLMAFYAINMNNTTAVKKTIDALVKFRNNIPSMYQKDLIPYMNNVLLATIATRKEAQLPTADNKSDLQEQIDYIKKAISEE